MKRTLQLELLSPAFVGGAEPRVLDPHMPLRPSTVRGLLRFWFRAAAGALIWPGDNSREAMDRALNAIRQVETALFGDTTRASMVVVLPPKGGKVKRFTPSEIDPAARPGFRYLGYGLFEDRHINPEALETSPGDALSLTLRLRRDLAGAKELVGATLWLWTAIGGVGARSRRGFGSLGYMEGGKEWGWPDVLCKRAENHGALVKQLNEGLDWVFSTFRQNLPQFTSHPLERGNGPHPELRTLDGIGTVTVLPVEAPDGLEALDRAGRLFRDYRSTLQRRRLGMPPLPDYFAVKTAIQSRRAPVALDRAAFGLPLPFYFRSLGGAKAVFYPQRGDRLASPLLFRVHTVGEGKDRLYVLVLINLGEANGARPLLGERVVDDTMAGATPSPDGKLINQFISWALAEAERAPYARKRRQP